MKQSIFLSVVTYSGEVEPETGEALKRSIPELIAQGIDVKFHRWVGDSLIADARNGVMAQFLESDSTDLVFIDSDVAWDGDELLKLVTYPVDLVAGVYRKKRDKEDYPIRWLDRKELQADPDTGLLEVETVPAGFMRMTRACLHRMTFYYADREYDHQVTGKAWCVFDCGLSERGYWGEDYTFCKRWRDTGGQVWIDPYMTLHHVGLKDPHKPHEGKRKYTGCIGEWLLNREEFKTGVAA